MYVFWSWKVYFLRYGGSKHCLTSKKGSNKGSSPFLRAMKFDSKIKKNHDFLIFIKTYLSHTWSCPEFLGSVWDQESRFFFRSERNIPDIFILWKSALISAWILYLDVFEIWNRNIEKSNWNRNIEKSKLKWKCWKVKTEIELSKSQNWRRIIEKSKLT